MPKKQRNKTSVGGGNGSAASHQPLAAGGGKGDGGGAAVGFPAHLLSKFNDNACDDAELEALVPNAVFVARQALSSKECREWINYAEEGDRWDAVAHPATKWIAHRECGRIQKNDWEMAHRLYRRIEQIVHRISPQLDIFDKASLLSNGVKAESINKSNNLPCYQPISCNPNLRLYKYVKGQWFGRHVDDSNKIDGWGRSGSPYSASDVRDAQTEITVLFYLSSCRGGATRFHLPHKKRKGGGSDGVAFVPEEGSVLLHVHGDRCLEHEAEPVLDGVKYGE